jgi:hypothetical protein
MIAKPRNVKSAPKSATTDAHERGKDFLDQAEIERLLAAARPPRPARLRGHKPEAEGRQVGAGAAMG